MADFYRLYIYLSQGSGEITINGAAPVQYYEENTVLNVSIVLDPGWTSIEWLGSPITGYWTGTSFSFTMPTQDYLVKGVADGDAAPVNGYGLLFFSEFPDVYNANTLRLEIYQDGFGGSSTEVEVNEMIINFGDNEKDLTTTILGTSLDFTLIGANGDYDLFLTGDIRTFRAIVKRGGNVIFDGYVSPDFLEFDDLAGNQYYSFTAIDGLKGFDAIRINSNIFPSGTSGSIGNPLSTILGSLNQTFVEGKKVNFICDIHEDSMNPLALLFNEFVTPESSIYTDGERTKFEDGVIIYNEKTSIKETLESLLRPFLCRVFIWDNEFWVIRIPDMYANSMTSLRYLPNTDFDATVIITNNLDLNCKITPKPRIRLGRVYTEFTAILNLGVLSLDAKGAVIEYKFDAKDWYLAGYTSPYPGRYVLKTWGYINARPTKQPSSVPSGEVALVQFSSDSGSEACKIWTTTTTSGLSDPNLSSIYLTTEKLGVFLADEIANKLSVEFEFMVLPVRSGLTNSYSAHKVTIQVKVGLYYLKESAVSDIYEFSLTPSFVQIQVPNTGVFNKVKISNVVIPTTDFIEVSLYQLVLTSGTRHQFAVSYKNFKLSIEENEAFTLSQLGAKGITTDQYSSVFKDYEINIGDTITNMSTSAIKLNITGSPVSELWTSKDFVSLPLLGGIVQDLANLYGRTNRRLSGTIYERELKPYQSLIYDGKLWVLLSFKWNLHKNSYDIEAFELGEIPTT